MTGDMSSDKAGCLVRLYRDALEFLEGNAQAQTDIERARMLTPESRSDKDFMREYAWTVFASGISGTTNKKKQPALTAAFCDWDPALIVRDAEACRFAALEVVNNESKVDAVLNAAHWVDGQGWKQIHLRLLEGMLTTMEENRFPGDACWAFLKRAREQRHLMWIQATNRRYLLKNLGFDLAKDDRQLRRQAKAFNYSEDGIGVQSMCEDISHLVKERVSVVDTVLWNSLSSGYSVRCC